jgi:hypothetical protein
MTPARQMNFKRFNYVISGPDTATWAMLMTPRLICGSSPEGLQIEAR